MTAHARTGSAITRHSLLGGATALAATPRIARAQIAQKPERIVFGTSWRAEAEHGGFYHAVATGLYRRQGLSARYRSAIRTAPSPSTVSLSTWKRASF